jgi:hypothetical protein
MTQAAILAASGSPGTTTGFKNKIINGACNIAQRNGTTAVTTNSNAYVIDMWACNANNNYGNWQWNQNSITPPAGFTNYVGGVSTGNYSFTGSDYCNINPVVEGYNWADLNWGSANAKTITISFWVRASITGTYSFAMSNGGANRTYRTTYTISAANTWEYKTITVAGDTSGTWQTTTSRGISIWFGAGWGTTYSAPANNAWASDFYFNSSGCVTWMGTSGATWYVTGLQVEVGTTATNFESRSYGTELSLCQRYLFVYNDGQSSGNASYGVGNVYNSSNINICGFFPTTMRIAPTGITVSSVGSFYINNGGANGTASSITYGGASQSSYQLSCAASGINSGTVILLNNNRSGQLLWSAEL